MSADTYIIGETLRATLTVTFDGTPTDPDSITAAAIAPDGISTAVTPTDETGDGKYAVAHTPSTSGPTGTWKIRVTATKSGNVEIEDVAFVVVP